MENKKNIIIIHYHQQRSRRLRKTNSIQIKPPNRLSNRNSRFIIFKVREYWSGSYKTVQKTSKNKKRQKHCIPSNALFNCSASSEGEGTEEETLRVAIFALQVLLLLSHLSLVFFFFFFCRELKADRWSIYKGENVKGFRTLRAMCPYIYLLG